MKVLITGAAGFLGRNFVWHHLSRGDEVVGVDDMSNPHSYWPLGVYEKWTDDVRNSIKFNPFKMGNFDIVYHFAAPVGGRLKIDYDPLFNAESLEIDTALIRWLAGLDKKPLLVYPSSSAVYPTGLQVDDSWGPLIESTFTPSNVIWGAPDEAYGFVKMSAEILLDKAAKYGVESIILRPFSGYGEGQSQDYPFPTLMRKVAKGDEHIVIWGTGLQVRDFIHVDDIVGATQALIDADFRGTINLATGKPTSMIDLVAMATVINDTLPKVSVDKTKPEGVRYRVGSTVLLDNFYRPKVQLLEGITRVLEYERTQ